MNFGQRLKELREIKEITQEELGKIINVSKPSISRYEAGTNEPNLETLNRLADFFRVTVDYLVGRTNNKSSKINFQLVPVLGTIKAGVPVLAEENWESQVEIPADLDADFALRVRGDSMSWVGIHDGDLAVLCHDNTASHGMIVAAGVEDLEWTATLKFYIKENGTPVLRAANPNYKDMPISSKHRIIGHVVSIIKDTPSILTYKNFLASKEMSDKGWDDVIDNAIRHGLDSKQVNQLMDLFSHMVKQIK